MSKKIQKKADGNNAGTENNTHSRQPEADGFMQIPDGVEEGLPFLD